MKKKEQRIGNPNSGSEDIQLRYENRKICHPNNEKRNRTTKPRCWVSQTTEWE